MSLLDGIQTLDDLELENQVVFVRADLDTPLTKTGEFTDDVRFASTAETVKRLQDAGARVVVASRFGETGRKLDKKKSEKAPSIEPAAARLSELCECDVFLPDACTGDSVKRVLLELRQTQLCVLENLLNEDDEGPQAEVFARKLQEYVDVYVADSMRALSVDSATTTILPRLLSYRVASPGLMRELSSVSRIRSGIDGPRLLIWGGNALSLRVDLLRKLAGNDAQVMLVGVAANTMLRALGGAVGKSAIEDDYLAGARTLAEQLDKRLIVPMDVVTATSPRAEEGNVRLANRIPESEMALDLGPETQQLVTQLIDEAGTIVWCGAAGFFKAPAFSSGTQAICSALAESAGFTMVIGDDSVASLRATSPDLLSQIDCVAQGGSSTLALLNETKLSGLEALRGNIS